MITLNNGDSGSTFRGNLNTNFGLAMEKASNLSDVANIATARQNLGLGYLSTLNYQIPAQGGLINGKINVTVASNNITLSILTSTGNTPSTSKPVYVRIGNTMRSITSALSVTVNAGTNTFNSGSPERATYERDYFPYIGYNSIDGVVIAFAGFPSANQYSDFSATTTNEKYCAISTITNATSTDYYEVIGRFAATLSGSASYNWSVPTFTAKNLINYPIFMTRWLTYLPTISGTGGSIGTFATTTNNGRYKIDRDTIYFHNVAQFSNLGSWTGTVTMKTPFTVANRVSEDPFTGYLCANATNPATASKGLPYTGGDNTSIQFVKSTSTSSVQFSDLASTDHIRVQGFYEI